MVFDAFPFLPLFVAGYADRIPMHQFVLGGLWLLILSSFVFARRENTVGHMLTCLRDASWPKVLKAAAMVLLVPGFLGWAGALLARVPMDQPSGSTRTIKHLNLVLDAYARPFTRAGVDINRVSSGMEPVSWRSAIPVHVNRRTTQADLDPEQPRLARLFGTRPMSLYPATYRFKLNGAIEPANQDPALRLALRSNDQDLFVARLNAYALTDSVIEWTGTYRAPGIMPASEFRADALDTRRFNIADLALEVSIP
jgi:hypothetical protein